jgi:chloramphenicol 3-O phosphotransferase
MPGHVVAGVTRYDVIVLNGTSSAGKSTIARALQTLLEEPFLTFGIDTLIQALPIVDGVRSRGIDFFSDGRIELSPEFRRAETAWYEGLAAIARAGTGIIVDEVFLDGARSQARVEQWLRDLAVLWVGVDCDVATALAREAARGDRPPGLVTRQALIVHDGVHYDLRVDTTTSPALDCARVISARVAEPPRR